MKKNYTTVCEAIAAYEDICGDARYLFAGGPNPEYSEYKGKSMTEILELYKQDQAEEACEIAQRYNDFFDAVDLDTEEEWDEFYRSIRYCSELEKARKLAGDI